LRARLNLRPRTLLPLVTLVFLVGPVGSASAQEPVQTQAREHVVRRGDTLWGLARAYLMNPFLWPRIFEANRSVVEDPHWIYPNERLLIPGLSDTLGVAITVAEEIPSQAVAEAQRRSRFYRPTTPVTEEEAETERQQMVVEREQPYALTPSEYASAAWLADTAALGIRGRITRLVDPATATDKLPSRLHPFDRLYIGQLRDGQPAIGDSLLAIGLEDEVGGYGRKVIPLALLRVEEHAEGSVIASVVHQYGTAKAGDYVIVAEPRPEMPRGVPAEMRDGPGGRIVAFLEDDPLKGTSDQGFIDLGRDQVELGDVLEVYLPENVAGGVELAAARVARLKVIRTEDRSSTVRVLQVSNTALANGMSVRVTQRTP
jgi:hypothetical protein